MRTVDMDATDFEYLDQWARRHQTKANQPERLEPGHMPEAKVEAQEPTGVDAMPLGLPKVLSTEAGLRVCPRCGKALHLSATVCRSCGEPAPRR